MKRITFEAQSRKRTGKLNVLRNESMVPGVVYDQKGSSDTIKLPASQVYKLLQDISGTPLIDLSIDGKDKQSAILKEVQYDVRRNTPIHLSFMVLDPKKAAVFDVEIVTNGESPAIKNSLGILLLTKNSLELKGLPEHVPSRLDADISTLENVGDTINVEDLSIPDELELSNEAQKDLPVVSIQPFQKTLEEETPKEESEEGIEGEEDDDEDEEKTDEDGVGSETSGDTDTDDKETPTEPAENGEGIRKRGKTESS